MTSNKAMFKSLQAGLDDERLKLYTTKRHAEYLEMPENERPRTERVADILRDIYLGKFKHERSGRFSPSSAGGCQRAALFSFHSAPQVGENLDSQDLMSHGTDIHSRWQAEGLEMGWMIEVEKWVYSKELNCGGSIDGILADGSLFELKTGAQSVYSRVLKEDIPKWEHRMQVEVYFELSGIDLASIVYEERNSGQFHEFRYQSDPETRAKALAWMASLNRWLDVDDMPNMLDDCEMRQGNVYRNCRYRKHCHAVAKGEA